MTTPEDDARAVFANLHRQHYPQTYREKQRAAAERLLADFFTLGKGLGLETSQDREGNATMGFGMSTLVFFTGRDGSIAIRSLAYSDPAPAAAVQAGLEYDPASDALVGTETDSEIAPTPGERLPRMHPIKVLTKLAEKLLDDGKRR